MKKYKSKKNKKTKKTKKNNVNVNNKKLIGGYFIQPVIQPQYISQLSQQFEYNKCKAQIAAYKINPKAGITSKCTKYKHIVSIV